MTAHRGAPLSVPVYCREDGQEYEGEDEILQYIAWLEGEIVRAREELDGAEGHHESLAVDTERERRMHFWT